MVRIAGVIKESIVDGKGLRLVVFTQGCPHNCKGCHNPETHETGGGYSCSAQTIVEEFLKNPLLAGITFSGGEPILQAKELLPVAQAVVQAGKDCVLYSGYTFEELTAMQNQDVTQLLSLCSWLIDGRFIAEQRDLSLPFRGSRNQRIIDLPKTLAQGSIVLAQA